MLQNLKSWAANEKLGFFSIIRTICFLCNYIFIVLANLVFIGKPSKEEYNFIISAHKQIFGSDLTFYHKIFYSFCGKHLIQIIRHEGKKAGFALLRVDPIWHIHFCKIGILESFRGKGLAIRMLMGSTVHWRSKGFKKMSVYVAKDNKRAIKSYKAAGFRTMQEGDELLYLEKMI